MWVPEHINAKRNGMTDKLTKQGADSISLEQSLSSTTSYMASSVSKMVSACCSHMCQYQFHINYTNLSLAILHRDINSISDYTTRWQYRINES